MSHVDPDRREMEFELVEMIASNKVAKLKSKRDESSKGPRKGREKPIEKSGVDKYKYKVHPRRTVSG